jgi:hypothetical protein
VGAGGGKDQKLIPLVVEHPGIGGVAAEQPAIRPSHHHANRDELNRRDQRGERWSGFTGEHRIAPSSVAGASDMWLVSPHGSRLVHGSLHLHVDEQAA